MKALTAVLIGLGSGVISGAFGIGGAVLSTPAIRLLLDTPAIVAVATTLSVAVVSALVGMFTYRQSGLVDLRLAPMAASSGALFAVLGALSTEVIQGEVLLLITAGLIMILAFQMLPKRVAVGAPRITPGVPAFLAVGAVSGFVSGLLGVGGGIILVPVFTVLFGLPIKMALGTSLAVIAAQAIPGTIVHALLGNIDWAIAAGLILGVIPGARVGAKLALAAEEARLRVVVALGMAGLAALLAANELRELLG